MWYVVPRHNCCCENLEKNEGNKETKKRKTFFLQRTFKLNNI